METRQTLAQMEKAGIDIRNMLQEVMIFTYIHKDRFSRDRFVSNGVVKTPTEQFLK